MDNWTRSRTLLFVEGGVFILLGLLAIVLPGLFTISFTLLLGGLLLVAGIVQAVRSIQNWRTSAFWPALISTILYLWVGFWLLSRPLLGVVALTGILTIFFVVEGFAKIILAFQMRHYARWGGLLASGILSLLLAVLIISGLPGSLIWTLGIIVGVYLLVLGGTLIALGTEAPRLQEL